MDIDRYFEKFFLLRQIEAKRRFKTKKELRESLPSVGAFKPSTFSNGISVNLLSVFRKEDNRFCLDKSLGYYDPWQEGTDALLPPDSDVNFQRAHFVGYRIGEIMKYKSKFTVKDNKGNPIREDTLLLKVKHHPTVTNFWHFDIILCGINSNTQAEYLLANEISGNQIRKIADGILDDIYDMAICEKATYPCYLEKGRYRR